jgi:hypothetical protein
MISRATLFVFLLLLKTTYLVAQGPSLDLSGVPDSLFRTQVKPLLNAVSLKVGHHPFYDRDSRSRFRLGFSLSWGQNYGDRAFAGKTITGFPLLHGAILVSNNMLLTSSLSGFISGEDLIHITSYGFDLFINEPGDKDWLASIVLGRLEGPRHLDNRTIDFLLRRNQGTKRYLYQYGVGISNYTTRITMPHEPLVPDRIKSSVPYFFASVIVPTLGFDLGIHVKMASQLLNLSLDLIREVR